MPLQKTRQLLNKSHTNSELSEASQDRLAVLESREKSEIQKLDQHLGGVAERIVDVEKGLDTDFVTKFVAIKGEDGLKKLFYDLSSTSPNRGFRTLQNFATSLDAGDYHKALYTGLDTDQSFLIAKNTDGSTDMKFTKYAIQVRRQEMVDHIIELMAKIDQHTTYQGQGVDLNDDDKSGIVESMMAARKLPEAKKNNIYHALMISMWADPQLKSRSDRDQIQAKMATGESGKLLDLITTTDQTTIKVLTGGGFLEVPNHLLSQLEIKYTARHGGRIYAMMKNGCEGNLIIIEDGPLKGEKTPEELTQEQYDKAIEQAHDREKQGRRQQAYDAYEEALRHKPNDITASDGKQRMEKKLQELQEEKRKAQLEQTKQDAKELEDTAEYTQAIQKYQEAQRLDTQGDYTQELQDAITRCEEGQAEKEAQEKLEQEEQVYQEALQEAQDLWGQNKFPEAIAKFEQAKTLDPTPTNPETHEIDKQIVEVHDGREIYHQGLVNQGDEAVNQTPPDYESAKKHYQNAIDTGFDDGGEAQRKLTEIEEIIRQQKEQPAEEKEQVYQEAKTEGEKLYDLGEYEKALPLLNKALGLSHENAQRDGLIPKIDECLRQIQIADNPPIELDEEEIEFEEGGVEEDEKIKNAFSQSATKGNTALREKRRHDAIKWYEEALKIHSENPGKIEEEEVNKIKPRLEYAESQLPKKEKEDEKKEKLTQPQIEQIEQRKQQATDIKESDPAAAIDFYEQILALDPVDQDALAGKQQAQELLDKKQKEELEKQKQEEIYTQHLEDASNHESTGAYQQAIASLQTAKAMNVNDTDDPKLAAKIQELTEQQKAKEQKEREAQQEQEKLQQYNTLMEKGKEQEQNQKFEAALSTYQQAQQIDNTNEVQEAITRVKKIIQDKLQNDLENKKLQEQIDFREDKETMTEEEARAFVTWINKQESPLTITFRKLDRHLGQQVLLKKTNRIQRDGPFEGTQVEGKGTFFVPTKVQKILLKADPKHTIQVPNSGLEHGTIELHKKHYIDSGLFTGNYPQPYQLISGSTEKAYMKSLMRRSGSKVYLPPYDHDASGGERTDYGRAKNPADVRKGYYNGEGGKDIYNHMIVTTQESDMEEVAYKRLRLIPTRMLELARMRDLEDVGDIDLLLTGKERWYREAIDDPSQYNQRQAERQRILNQGILKGQQRRNFNEDLGIRCRGLNLGLTKLKKEHTPVSKKHHQDKEGVLSYENTRLDEYTKKNPWYKIDYLGSSLSYYSGELALGLGNVTDQQLLQHLLKPLQQRYDGPSLTLGVKNIKPETASLLENMKTQRLSFWHNPCGSNTDIMQSLIEFLNNSSPKSLHFYTLSLNELEQLKGAFQNIEGNKNATIEFDNITRDDLKKDQEMLNTLFFYPGKIILDQDGEKVELLDAKVRKNGKVRYQPDDTRLDSQTREEKMNNQSVEQLQEEQFNYSPTEQPLEQNKLVSHTIGRGFDINSYRESVSYAINVQEEATAKLSTYQDAYEKATAALQPTQSRYEKLQNEVTALQASKKEQQQSLDKAKAARDVAQKKLDGLGALARGEKKQTREEIEAYDKTIQAANDQLSTIQKQLDQKIQQRQTLQQQRRPHRQAQYKSEQERTILLANHDQATSYVEQQISLWNEAIEKALESGALPLWLAKSIIPQKQLYGVRHEQFQSNFNKVRDIHLRKKALSMILYQFRDAETLVGHTTMPPIPINDVMIDLFGMTGVRDGFFTQNEVNTANVIDRKVIARLQDSYDRKFREKKEILESNDVPGDIKYIYMNKFMKGELPPQRYKNMLALTPVDGYKQYQMQNFVVVSKKYSKMCLFNKDGVLVQIIDQVITGRDISDGRITQVNEGRTPGGPYMLAKGPSLQTNYAGPFAAMIPLDSTNQYDSPLSYTYSGYKIGSTAGIHKIVSGRNPYDGTQSNSCINTGSMDVVYDHIVTQKYEHKIERNGQKQSLAPNAYMTKFSMLYVCHAKEQEYR